MLIVVFDTNILFSAIGWRGNPYRCLELAQKRAIHGVICRELVDELAEKLQSKLNFSDDMIAETIADLLSFMQLVPISNNLQFILADPDDDVVLECAVAGEAHYIVSGDRRHLLPIGNYEGITILTATQFLELIQSK